MDAQHDHSPAGYQYRPNPPRVLCLDHDDQARADIAEVLNLCDAQTIGADSVQTAAALCKGADYDVLLVDVSSDTEAALEFVTSQSASGAPARVVVTCNQPDAGLSIRAMRCGAVDLIVKPYLESELIERVTAACNQAEALRRQARRVDRLKRICKRLNASQEEPVPEYAANHLGEDLGEHYKAVSGQVSAMTMATEFGGLVRAELDVESLLRMTIEYLLSRTGPTNAAVFLPTGMDDFALGAYVVNDVDRENADVVLDHLADVLPERFKDAEGIERLQSAEDLAEQLGDDANWLADSDVVVFSCRPEGECLAVVAVFRDRKVPFTDAAVLELEVLREMFGEQLSRVIRVHNRHKPAGQVPGFSVDEEDDNVGGGFTFESEPWPSDEQGPFLGPFGEADSEDDDDAGQDWNGGLAA